MTYLKYRNPSIFNMIHWLAGSMGQTRYPPSVWCSKHYFFFIISYTLRALKTLYFCFCKIIKEINWNNFCKEFCKKSWKNKIIGTSEAWSMSRSSQWPSDQATQHIILKIDGFLENEPQPWVITNFSSKLLNCFVLEHRVFITNWEVY